MAPLRIGLDAREAWRFQPRGIGLYARHLIREFGDLCPEHEFVLYHERDRPEDLPELPPNMTPRRASIPGSRFHSWERVLMPVCLRRDRLSVYHGTFNTLPPRIPLWRGPPMVVSIHDVIVTWYDEQTDDPYVKYCRAATSRIVKDAEVILTVSQWSKQDLVERYDVPESKIRIFYNGVHPDFLAGAPEGAADAARKRFANGRPYLFTVGAPLPRKNTAGLLAALALMHQRKSLEHLVLIAGLRAETAKSFAEMAQTLGIEDQVRFLPYVTRAELIGLYAGADLSIYPSMAEGWGIPVVESLVVGTPVATSNTTAMPEAGGAHATYFDPHDRESIADGITRALANRTTFDGIRQEAIARARTFTWRRAAEVTYATYLDVTGSASGRTTP